MCYGCFKEYGAFNLTPRAREAAKSIAAVYEIHLVGGAAHIVVEDWNLEDDMIDSCLVSADPVVGYDACATCRTCLEQMLALSVPERVAAMALHNGFIDNEGNET